MNLMLGFPEQMACSVNRLCLDEGLVMKIIDGTIASPLGFSADGLRRL